MLVALDGLVYFTKATPDQGGFFMFKQGPQWTLDDSAWTEVSTRIRASACRFTLKAIRSG